MRQLVLGLSVSFAFILGCLVGAVAPSTSVAPASAEGGFSYKCIRSPATTFGSAVPVDELANRMNELGRSGWELVTGAGDGPTWCFKRRSP